MTREKRRVLVTGANSGIGLATSLHLAGRGFSVVGSCRSAEKADAFAQAAADRGLEVETVLFDVTDAEESVEIVSGLELYGLVNNAGYNRVGAVEDTDADDAAHQIDTLMLAPMRLARAALPAMIERGEGRIVNVSSVFGFMTIPLNGYYQAAKHGLEALTDALRNELASTGVKVVSVQPGGVTTEIWQDLEAVGDRTAVSRHADAYLRVRRFMHGYRGMMSTSERVAEVIHKAMAKPHPRSRYLVGGGARAVQVADAIIPQFAQDRLTRAILGM